MVHILQTPTLGAAKTCDEPGIKEEVCHCDRRAGLNGLADGLNSVMAMCTYRLGGLGYHPSSHQQQLFSREIVYCRRWRLLVWGCSDVLGKMRRVGGSMRVEGAHSLSSKCQTAIPLRIIAVACSSRPRFEVWSSSSWHRAARYDHSQRVGADRKSIDTHSSNRSRAAQGAGTGWLQESEDPPTYEAPGSPSLGRSERA